MGCRELFDGEQRPQENMGVREAHAAGEVMMQLLTLNTEPIDDAMRKSILAFVDSGQHIKPSSALSWPTSTAETFEMVAVACMRAGESEDTAKALNDGVVPALQSMRGETVQSLWKQSGAAAKQRADGSFIAPAAYRYAVGQLLSRMF